MLRKLVQRRFGRDRRGNVAMIAGLLVPVVAVGVAGGVELGFLMTDKSKLQAAADAAALTTAHELALAVNDGVAERAEALALAQAEDLQGRSSVTADASIVQDGENRAIRVVMTANRDSFFGNLIPPGGFTTQVESTAVGMSRTPLCILIDGKGPGAKVLNAVDSARVEAEGCLIHSNKDIEVEGAARVRAGAVQSVGDTVGQVEPKAEVGAEKIVDPFAQTNLGTNLPCTKLSLKVITKLDFPLKPGRYCETITVQEGGKLRLTRGDYHFTGASLILKENAVITGNDVVLIFDDKSKFEFRDTSTVDLTGRKKGALAGFVLATTRQNKNDFLMWSNNIKNLLGVVYLPETTLIVQGNSPVAQQSAWTVIVAERLLLKEAPTLVINRNYAVSDVPVPRGVGNVNTEARLSQ